MLYADVQYCSYHELPVERYVNEHEHSCFELVYFYSGYGTTIADKQLPYRFREGDYVIFRPYEAHDETHETPTETYCIGFSLDKEHSLVLSCGLFRDENSQLWPLIEKIHNEVQEESYCHDEMINLYCSELLIHHQRLQGATRDQESNLLGNVINYIDENYMQDINIAMLSQMAGYSYDYFRHRFAAETGVSPMHYIINKRIQLACQLLCHSSLSVTNIAYHCGFSSTPLFSSSFKKAMGISPLAYRKQNHYVNERVIWRDL